MPWWLPVACGGSQWLPVAHGARGTGGLRLGGVGTQVMKVVELIQGAGRRLLAALGWRHSGEQGHPDLGAQLWGLSQNQVRAQSKGSGRASKGLRDAGGEEDEWGLAGAVCRLPWAVPGVCALSLGPTQGQHPREHPAATPVGGRSCAPLRPTKDGSGERFPHGRPQGKSTLRFQQFSICSSKP